MVIVIVLFTTEVRITNISCDFHQIVSSPTFGGWKKNKNGNPEEQKGLSVFCKAGL